MQYASLAANEAVKIESAVGMLLLRYENSMAHWAGRCAIMIPTELLVRAVALVNEMVTLERENPITGALIWRNDDRSWSYRARSDQQPKDLVQAANDMDLETVVEVLRGVNVGGRQLFVKPRPESCWVSLL